MVMRSIDLLWFEDIDPFNESVFDFPILGRLSMRQMLVLGIGAIISYALYQSTNNITSSIIPVSIMGFVALKKQNVLTTEQMMLSIIMYAVRGLATKRERKHFLRSVPTKEVMKESARLYPAREFAILEKGKRKQIEVTVRDLMKPVRMKMKLLLSSGEVLANKMTKVYLDDDYIASVSSDINGELEVLLIPKREGERRLKVYAVGFADPVLDELLAIRS